MRRTVDPNVLEDAGLVHREHARSLGDATRMMEGKTKEAAEARRESMRGFYRGSMDVGHAGVTPRAAIEIAGKHQ